MNRGDNFFGFTIVELTLAMGFVSALLLAIAMTVIQIGNTYNRGITYKNVNQAGGQIIKEIQTSINSSEPFAVSGAGSNFYDKNFGGRLCSGKYTYVWNYGSYLTKTPRNTYKTPNSDVPIRFIKVYDPDSLYCSNASGSYPDIDMLNATELLDAGQHNLAIHGFDITSDPAVYDGNTMQQLYSVELLIGTNNPDALKNSFGVVTGCLDPSESKSDSSYCSVSKFNLVARAGNAAE